MNLPRGWFRWEIHLGGEKKKRKKKGFEVAKKEGRGGFGGSLELFICLATVHTHWSRFTFVCFYSILSYSICQLFCLRIYLFYLSSICSCLWRQYVPTSPLDLAIADSLCFKKKLNIMVNQHCQIHIYVYTYMISVMPKKKEFTYHYEISFYKLNPVWIPCQSREREGE